MNRELARRVSAAAFEERYTQCADPWEFATSRYETNRFQTILQALSRTSYGVVYEPGCSVGVLTAQLAARAKFVLAADFSQSAVAAAKDRCAGRGNVEILCESVATYVPPAPLDLVVLSEIGYYFEPAELARIGRALEARLVANGEFVACHWLGHSEDHVLHGDAVHETLLSHLSCVRIRGERHGDFRIDTWIKP